jgi:4-aminobutyrate aminotransferase-like enzyme
MEQHSKKNSTHSYGWALIPMHNRSSAFPAGLYFNCVRFLPPLNISHELIDEGMDGFGLALQAVRGKAG